VLSGRGLCDELITRPEESYWLYCVVVCDLETSIIGAPYIYDISNLKVNTLELLQRQMHCSIIHATLSEGFPFSFLSFKANARVYLAKTGHCPHSSHLVNCVVLCILCV
jgi:hypothetical protein